VAKFPRVCFNVKEARIKSESKVEWIKTTKVSPKTFLKDNKRVTMFSMLLEEVLENELHQFEEVMQTVLGDIHKE
jgi:hypothetical protein